MRSYFKAVVRPNFNCLMNMIPGKKPLGEYFRVFKDSLLPNKQIFANIVIIMTTKCTLRCENCNNLMPYYHSPYHIPSEQLISDIRAFLDNIDTCVKLSLLGGEPFIYPELTTVIDAVIDHPAVMYLSLTTNGTVIPDEEVMKRLRHRKIVLHISDYGVSTQKIPQLIEILKGQNIRYTHKKDTDWVVPGGTKYRGKSKEQLKIEYNNCYSSRYCGTMLNGKMYLCARGAHLTDLGFMDEPHDWFDIRKKRTAKEFQQQFKEFYLSDYAEACNYCDHGLKISVKAGVQTDKILEPDG